MVKDLSRRSESQGRSKTRGGGSQYGFRIELPNLFARPNVENESADHTIKLKMEKVKKGLSWQRLGRAKDGSRKRKSMDHRETETWIRKRGSRPAERRVK